MHWCFKTSVHVGVGVCGLQDDSPWVKHYWSNYVFQCRYWVHGAHQQMNAFTICCMISSRSMCDLGLFIV
jgi:hypothetical protein